MSNMLKWFDTQNCTEMECYSSIMGGLEKVATNQMLRRDQVNLLVYGPDRPYFKQKKIYIYIYILRDFGFFKSITFRFLKKKKGIKHNKLI